MTPLIYVMTTQSNKKDNINLLFERGADPILEDDFGNTPLSLAEQQYKSTSESKKILNIISKSAENALIKAIRNGKYDNVEKLLKHGVSSKYQK